MTPEQEKAQTFKKKRKPGRPPGRRSSYTLSPAAREQRRQAGQATLKKHGKKHYSNMGIKGSAVLWERYRLAPHPSRPGSYVFINRKTGRPASQKAVNPRR